MKDSVRFLVQVDHRKNGSWWVVRNFKDKSKAVSEARILKSKGARARVVQVDKTLIEI